MTDSHPMQQALAQVVRRAGAEPAYKAALRSDPVATLRDAGIPWPDGVRLSVVEDTTDHVHLVLPPLPAEGEQDDAQLTRVAAGGVGADVYDFLARLFGR